jgi:NADH dehydrogenase [ubiquinone] 1 alpha subcomplex assembly factor 7
VSGPELLDKIARRIGAEGPLSVAAFMAMALHDPQHGYYATCGPIGRDGDFITAPEISQIFGELIGLWCADLWQRSGAPDPVNLVELGPGRGTLMQDLLRAAAGVPAFHRAMRLHLVEASPLLRAEQQRRLAGSDPCFVASLDEIPAGPLFVVANEFLDALPVRQFVRGRADWAERLVGFDGQRLVFVAGPESPTATLLVSPPMRDAPPGTIVEIGTAAASLAGVVAERLRRDPGAALFVDYGYADGGSGSTLAGLRAHQPVSALEMPGETDLSAHVDFEAVAVAARAAGAQVYGPIEQGCFLAMLGAGARLQRLTEHATAAQREALEAGLKRLIDPAQMGTLFKALAIVSPGSPAPAGFAPPATPAANSGGA